MAHQIFVFDAYGRIISETNWSFEVNDVINLAGPGRVTVPFNDLVFQQFQEELVKVGNIVLVRDDRCGDWAGIMETPYEWARGSIDIPLFSYEYALRYRSTAGLSLAGTADTVLKNLIAQANVRGDTLIDPSGITAVGNNVAARSRSPNIYDFVVNTLVNEGDFDWWVSPEFDERSGKIRFVCNAVNRRGIEVATHLHEGSTLMEGNIVYRQDGPVINSVFTYTDTGALVSTTPLTNSESRLFYGLREDSLMGTTFSAQTLLNERSHARDLFYPVAIEKDDGAFFEDLRVGNICGLTLVNYGFTNGKLGVTGKSRILARKFYNEAGADYRTMGLTVVKE